MSPQSSIALLIPQVVERFNPKVNLAVRDEVPPAEADEEAEGLEND
jgi:hypothetical protein